MGVDKEKLRQLFGWTGDIRPSLEQMFGDVYLDHPDQTQDNVPTDLLQFNVAEVGDIVDRAIEQAAEIDCQTNQSHILKYLSTYILDKGSEVDRGEWWQVIKHMERCWNGPCTELYDIAKMDRLLTPEAMKEAHGKKINNWKV